MRANPNASLALSGASGKGAKDGKVIAESVKQYMVTSFGINESRITTQGRIKPLIPSEQPGATKELVLLRQGDRRVDIQSASPELLMEVGGDMMKPVVINATQVDPLDSHIIMNVAGAKKLFTSWSVDMKDDKGVVQHYGPFNGEQATLPGSSVLGSSPEGNYQVVMTGTTKDGLTLTKESTVQLMRPTENTEKGYRYSILFDFDKSKSIASYEKFLVNVVAPLVTDGSTVIIHGHTDIIGNEGYNQTLSKNRAQEAQKVLENALSAAGKTNVKFESFGFGEDVSHMPFENSLPEERFYNRTVIIDIVSVK